MRIKDFFTFTGYIFKEDEGYSSICPDIDVASQGESIAEAKENLIEAIDIYIESAIENNLPVIRNICNEENPCLIRSDDVVKKFPIRINLSVKAYA